MRGHRFITVLILLLLMAAGDGLAQRMPERSLVRKGNRQHDRGDLDKSIDSYSRALVEAPQSFEASFNLATAQARKGMFDRSEKRLRQLYADTLRSDIERGEIAYNLGNTLFAQQRLEEALNCYRDAMRFNGDDMEAKFNYAYTKALLQQQQQQQQQQQNDQNEDKENKDDKQDKQEQNQQQQQNDQQQQKNEQKKQQPQQSEMSEREQEAMLEAIQAAEDKTQEKLKEKQGFLIRGQKNW